MIVLAWCADLCTIITMMVTDDQIAGLIRSLAAARGWSESYAAKRATGSGDTLDRIDQGIGLTLRRANRIIARVADLWPDGEPVPPEIQSARPTERAA